MALSHNQKSQLVKLLYCSVFSRLRILLKLRISRESRMKAYSLDFRQKILDVYNKEDISQRQLAKRFDVALSFVFKLLKQYRTKGEIAPKPFNGGVKLKLSSDNLVVLAELIEQNNDATLDELCQMLEGKLGINIARATMGRMTQKLQLTVKKNSLSE
jgi:transposase